MVALKFTNGYIDKRIHDRNRYRGYGSFGFDHGYLDSRLSISRYCYWNPDKCKGYRKEYRKIPYCTTSSYYNICKVPTNYRTI